MDYGFESKHSTADSSFQDYRGDVRLNWHWIRDLKVKVTGQQQMQPKYIAGICLSVLSHFLWNSNSELDLPLPEDSVGS